MSTVFSDEPSFVLALRQSEPRALDELCRRYSRLVEVAVHRVLGNDADAPDVAQEALLHAIRGASRFQGESKQLGAWVHTIATRTACGFLRRKIATRNLFVEWEPDDTSGLAATPEDREALQKVLEMLARLAPKEKKAFAMRAIEGRSLDEVAQECEVSTSTAKRHVKRVRGRLQPMAHGLFG